MGYFDYGSEYDTINGVLNKCFYKFFVTWYPESAIKTKKRHHVLKTNKQHTTFVAF